MSQRATICVLGLVAILAGVSCLGQDVHILLRPRDGRTSFHLGEPISLEAACVASGTERYLLPCAVVIQAEAVSAGSRLTADRIDQMTWEDAQCGALPPEPRGVCGTISNQLPSKQSQVPVWQEVTLEEPLPAYAGQYRIKASVAIDLEVSERFGSAERHAASGEVEIMVDDNLGWKDRLIHFHNCDYDDLLTVLPDVDAIAALRQHMDDCAVDRDESFAEILHEIVWLKMQVEQPELYARMLELERGSPVLRGEEEADLQKRELAQAQLTAAGDANRIRQWFHEQYRALLLQTARQLVHAYKSHPELHGNEEFEDSLESGFENWNDVAAAMFDDADSYVSRKEVADFLKQAGRSQKYVAQFLKERKSHLPLMSPEPWRNRGRVPTSSSP
jgi:hypothetical protein